MWYWQPIEVASLIVPPSGAQTIKVKIDGVFTDLDVRVKLSDVFTSSVFKVKVSDTFVDV